MKLSEFITRLHELQRVHGGDPDVGIRVHSDEDTDYFEVAIAELSFVVPNEPGSEFNWYAKRELPDSAQQIIEIS